MCVTIGSCSMNEGVKKRGGGVNKTRVLTEGVHKLVLKEHEEQRGEEGGLGSILNRFH